MLKLDYHTSLEINAKNPPSKSYKQGSYLKVKGYECGLQVHCSLKQTNCILIFSNVFLPLPTCPSHINVPPQEPVTLQYLWRLISPKELSHSCVYEKQIKPGCHVCFNKILTLYGLYCTCNLFISQEHMKCQIPDGLHFLTFLTWISWLPKTLVLTVCMSPVKVIIKLLWHCTLRYAVQIRACVLLNKCFQIYALHMRIKELLWKHVRLVTREHRYLQPCLPVHACLRWVCSMIHGREVTGQLEKVESPEAMSCNSASAGPVPSLDFHLCGSGPELLSLPLTLMELTMQFLHK